MAQISFSQTAHAEQIGDAGTSASGKNQGTLKTEGKDYSIFVFSDSESVTEAASKFLQEINSKESPPELLQDFEFIHISQGLIEVENEIADLIKDLAKTDTSKEASTQKNQTEGKTKIPEKTELGHTSKQGQESGSHHPSNGRSEVVYSSLFSLARSFHTTLSESRQKKEGEQKSGERTQAREEGRPLLLSPYASRIEQKVPQESRYDREGNGKQDREKQEDEKEGFSQNQEQKQNHHSSKQQDKKKKIVSIGNVQAARNQPRGNLPHAQTTDSKGNQRAQNKGSQGPLGSMQNIYIRFMALMARILGQAEYEAHQLYLRIKDRTDAIDVLTLLISKVNSEKSAIDWSNNEEMKKLIEKARSIGVDIPEGKYKWSEEGKKLLKENVQMRKDSMEKMTQLERTDMQRYLQEASQCHQARSNVLKLLKEVIDTFVHNIRPG